jgi:hypothetical protein
MFIACLAALLLVGGPAFAQDDSGEPAASDDAATGEAAEGEAAEGEAAEGEAAEGEAAEGEAAEGEAAEPALGPGGRPLRTDYPGTEESLQERMDTNKIEGFEVDPNAPSEAYGLRIKELETKIDDLKEKVFQSKTRIVLLRETLLSGAVGGSQALIIHRTELGPAFKLRQAIYSLDGTRIFSEVDNDGSLADKTSFRVHDGPISPGNHNLAVYLRYQGSGYGVFNYFEGYDFEMRNSCNVPAKEGKIAVITSKAVTQGNVTTSKENKPTLECEVSYRDTGKVGDDLEAEGSVADDAAESTDE